MCMNGHKCLINIHESFMFIRGHLCSWTSQAADPSGAAGLGHLEGSLTSCYSKNICEKWFFRKCLFLCVLAFLRLSGLSYFFRKCFFSAKSLRHLRKMTIFAHGKMAVLRGHFSQMPDSGDDGKSFAKISGSVFG